MNEQKSTKLSLRHREIDIIIYANKILTYSWKIYRCFLHKYLCIRKCMDAFFTNICVSENLSNIFVSHIEVLLDFSPELYKLHSEIRCWKMSMPLIYFYLSFFFFLIYTLRYSPLLFREQGIHEILVISKTYPVGSVKPN